MQDVLATRTSHPRTGSTKTQKNPKSRSGGETHREAQRALSEPHRRDQERAQESAALAGGVALAFSAGVLLARGLHRRSWSSVAMAFAGAPVAYRKATGRWPMPAGVTRNLAEHSEPISLEASVTIGRPAAELYEVWRQLKSLPRFMRHLESVRETGDGRSHWVARTPTGGRVEWDAEIVEDRPGQLLSWRSLPGSPVETSGSVLFGEAPAGRGTVVRVAMDLRAADGLDGNATVRTLSLLGGLAGKTAGMQVREDLRRFKELMETGEIPTTQGQPHGERGAIDLKNPL